MENKLKANLSRVLKIAFAVMLAFIFTDTLQNTAPNVFLSVQNTEQNTTQSLHEVEAFHQTASPIGHHPSHIIAEIEENTVQSQKVFTKTSPKNKLVLGFLTKEISKSYQLVKSNWVPDYIRYCSLKIPF